MRKTIIKNELELLEAIEFFGQEWEDEIKAEVKQLPCILISSHCIDIEFGEYYQFTSINTMDIIKLNHQQEICLN